MDHTLGGSHSDSGNVAYDNTHDSMENHEGCDSGVPLELCMLEVCFLLQR